MFTMDNSNAISIGKIPQSIVILAGLPGIADDELYEYEIKREATLLYYSGGLLGIVYR